MNQAIIKQLPEELQVLYALSRKKKLDYRVARLVRDEVTHIRRDMRSSAIDALARKAKDYGNAGAWGREKLRELARLVFQDKAPDHSDLGKWLSVELELIMPNKAAENTFVKFVRAKGYAKAITIKNDGSIHVEREEAEHEPECYDSETDELLEECPCYSAENKPYGREIVATFKHGDWTLITDICRELNRLGCKVNKSCGLHVHFDCRHIKARSVTNLAARLANTVDALKLMLPKSRRNNSYCAEKVNGHRGGSRYAFVNVAAYRKHRTLEIRGHSGTTDATKIINWIRVLRTIMDTRNTAPVATVAELLSTFRFAPDLAAYVYERVQKFNPAPSEFVGPMPAPADDVAADNSLGAGPSHMAAQYTYDDIPF